MRAAEFPIPQSVIETGKINQMVYVRRTKWRCTGIGVTMP
jgi:hypothetical protein